MDINKKLDELFNESLASRKGFGTPITDPKHRNLFMLRDKKRKQKERDFEKRLKNMHKKNEDSIKTNGIVQHHPREFLQTSPLRFTLKESFIYELIQYVQNGNVSHLKTATALMEEYPNLYKYVTETSRKAFNNSEMSVYSIREHLNEEVGNIIQRPNGLKIAHLSIHELENKYTNRDGYMILEAKISPDKILIYIPTFTKLMEELIFSGKIEEPETNILRDAKRQNEILLLPSINEGVVIKIN